MPCTLHYSFQILRKYSPGPPKSFKILLKSTPDVTERPSGALQWTPHRKKFDFDHQKSGLETSRSAQERHKWIEMSTNVQHFSRLFSNTIFQPILHRFFEAPNLTKSGFRLGETLIFAKLTFSKKVPKITTFGTHFGEKKHEKSMKI